MALGLAAHEREFLGQRQTAQIADFLIKKAGRDQ
jgi:hypothetical protein